MGWFIFIVWIKAGPEYTRLTPDLHQTYTRVTPEEDQRKTFDTNDEVLPAGETAISLDTQTTETGNVANIYAVPMSLTSTGLSLTGGSDGAENSSDNGYAYTLMMRTDEGSFQYGRSQYLTTLALG